MLNLGGGSFSIFEIFPRGENFSKDDSKFFYILAMIIVSAARRGTQLKIGSFALCKMAETMITEYIFMGCLMEEMIMAFKPGPLADM